MEQGETKTSCQVQLWRLPLGQASRAGPWPWWATWNFPPYHNVSTSWALLSQTPPLLWAVAESPESFGPVAYDLNTHEG